MLTGWTFDIGKWIKAAIIDRQVQFIGFAASSGERLAASYMRGVVPDDHEQVLAASAADLGDVGPMDFCPAGGSGQLD